MSRCFQLSAVWLSAAETPLGQGRPGCGNHLAIGPAAQGAWCGGTNRSHSKTNGPNIDMTQVQPRTPREVLRGERPKRVLVPFGRAKGTPSGKRPHQAGKPERGLLEEQLLSLPSGSQLPLHRGAFGHGMAPSGASPAGALVCAGEIGEGQSFRAPFSGANKKRLRGTAAPEQKERRKRRNEMKRRNHSCLQE